MLLKKLYDVAAPRLKGRRVREVRIGAELLAVVLDDGRMGVAYSFPGERAEALPDVKALVGMPALELAAGLLTEGLLERAMGLAACSAVAEPDSAHWLKDVDAAEAVATRPTDTVGLVGFIRPVAARLQGHVARLIIFDRSEREGVYPEEEQPALLPECDLVFITGSSLTNGTLERLLGWCTRAREVAVLGPTTPLYPEIFAGTRVTVLAGATWPKETQQAALEAISQGACYRDISSLSHRWVLRVESK